jgi:threonine dehydrogenase-like Zn-dependent dehydrogenase
MTTELKKDINIQPDLDHSSTMKAVVWKGKENVKINTVPRPLITDPGDVIIKVTATTICGSDLHLYDNSVTAMKKGDILGHEFMGIIIDKGTDVKTLELGLRVVVSFSIACGTCEYCVRGQYTACDVTNPSKEQKDLYGHNTSAMFGYSHLTGGVPGGQAEYVRVPFADVNCLVIPDDIPDYKGLFLSDVLCTSYFGVENGRVKAGSTVAIWGLGPIGLLAARWCQIRGASTIIGIDGNGYRLEAAQHLGITTINRKKHDVEKAIKDLLPEGVDVCIECAGGEYAESVRDKVEMTLGLETDTAEIFDQMMKSVKKFGHVSVLGVYLGYCNHFPVGAMMEKGVTVKCGQAPVQKYWKEVLEYIQSGEMDPTFIISHRGSLSDAPHYYDLFYNRKEHFIKPVLTMDTFK